MKAGDTIGCKEIKKTFVIDEVIMGIAHFEWEGVPHQVGIKALVMLGYEVVKKIKDVREIKL